MFKLFKPKKSKVISFLEEADDAYILAYKTRDVKEFAKYATQPVVRELMESVLSADPIYFGLQRYRHRTWNLVEDGNTIYVYFKDVTHDNVEIVHKIAIPVADSISERWTLSKDNNKYIVTDIRRR